MVRQSRSTLPTGVPLTEREGVCLSLPSEHFRRAARWRSIFGWINYADGYLVNSKKVAYVTIMNIPTTTHGKRLKRASSFEIRAFHEGVLTPKARNVVQRIGIRRHTRPYKRTRIYTLTYHTYHVSAHYVWERAFRASWGRE